MAYPFAQMPTWGDFRDRLVSQHGCSLKTIQVDGADLPYLECNANGKVFVAVAQNLPDDQRLTPSVIRSVCARLGLDVRNVEEGFHLG